MPTLGSERRRHARMSTVLEAYFQCIGVDWCRDEGKRCKDCPNTHPESTHKVGLGQDYILYGPGGQWPYPNADTILSEAHDLWDLLGGAPRIIGDLGHFSIEWNGVR